MDAEKEKKMVISVMKSIIVSVKGGLPFTSLDADYREQNGNRIPYRKFGYSSLEEFVGNVPEIRVGKTGGGVLLTVVDPKTAHITSLLDRQRAPKKRIRAQKRGFAPRTSYGRPSARQPPRFQGTVPRKSSGYPTIRPAAGSRVSYAPAYNRVPDAHYPSASDHRQPAQMSYSTPVTPKSSYGAVVNGFNKVREMGHGDSRHSAQNYDRPSRCPSATDEPNKTDMGKSSNTTATSYLKTHSITQGKGFVDYVPLDISQSSEKAITPGHCSSQNTVHHKGMAINNSVASLENFTNGGSQPGPSSRLSNSRSTGGSHSGHESIDGSNCESRGYSNSELHTNSARLHSSPSREEGKGFGKRHNKLTDKEWERIPVAIQKHPVQSVSRGRRIPHGPALSPVDEAMNQLRNVSLADRSNGTNELPLAGKHSANNRLINLRHQQTAAHQLDRAVDYKLSKPRNVMSTGGELRVTISNDCTKIKYEDDDEVIENYAEEDEEDWLDYEDEDEATDVDISLEYQKLLLKPKFCSHQLIGDDFLLHFSLYINEPCDRIGNRLSQCGLCISGQTIAMCTENILCSPVISDSVIMLIGTVDILLGADSSSLRLDMIRLLTVIDDKVKVLQLCTIPPLGDLDSEAASARYLFNRFIKTMATDKIRVIDFDVHPFLDSENLLSQSHFQEMPLETLGIFVHPIYLYMWNDRGLEEVRRMIQSRVH